MIDKDSIFYHLCRHHVSIMDGWIPVPSTWLSHLTGLSLYKTCKQLKALKEQGLVDSDLWVEYTEERPILVRGYIVTDKGRQTEEYREAYEGNQDCSVGGFRGYQTSRPVLRCGKCDSIWKFLD